MRKKILATLLATTMVVGSTLGVTATEINTPGADGAYSSTVTGDSVITTPTIKITVPTSVSLTIDPYNIGTKGQIASDDQYIKNESNVAISVGMGLYAEKKTDESEVVLASAALKGNETTKSVFAYADIVSSTNGTSATHADAYDSKSAAQFALAYGTADKYTSKANMITLAKGDSTPTYAAYRFQGSVATKNAKAWADTDLIKVTVIFNFTPVLPAE